MLCESPSPPTISHIDNTATPPPFSPPEGDMKTDNDDIKDDIKEDSEGDIPKHTFTWVIPNFARLPKDKMLSNTIPWAGEQWCVHAAIHGKRTVCCKRTCAFHEHSCVCVSVSSWFSPAWVLGVSLQLILVRHFCRRVLLFPRGTPHPGIPYLAAYWELVSRREKDPDWGLWVDFGFTVINHRNSAMSKTASSTCRIVQAGFSRMLNADVDCQSVCLMVCLCVYAACIAPEPHHFSLETLAGSVRFTRHHTVSRRHARLLASLSFPCLARLALLRSLPRKRFWHIARWIETACCVVFPDLNTLHIALRLSLYIFHGFPIAVLHATLNHRFSQHQRLSSLTPLFFRCFSAPHHLFSATLSPFH